MRFTELARGKTITLELKNGPVVYVASSTTIRLEQVTTKAVPSWREADYLRVIWNDGEQNRYWLFKADQVDNFDVSDETVGVI